MASKEERRKDESSKGIKESNDLPVVGTVLDQLVERLSMVPRVSNLRFSLEPLPKHLALTPNSEARAFLLVLWC